MCLIYSFRNGIAIMIWEDYVKLTKSIYKSNMIKTFMIKC